MGFHLHGLDKRSYKMIHTFNRIFYHFLINFFLLLFRVSFSRDSFIRSLWIRNELKITLVPHLKYANDEDLKQVGLSKPEIRRLRKFYEKYYPHGYLSKIRRLLQNPAGKREEVGVSSFCSFPFSLHSLRVLLGFV